MSKSKITLSKFHFTFYSSASQTKTSFWTNKKIEIKIAFISVNILHVMKNTILSKTKADININIPYGKCYSPCLQIDIYFLTNREKCKKTQNVLDKPNDTRDLKRFILVLCQLHIKRPEFEIICTLNHKYETIIFATLIFPTIPKSDM